MATRLSVNINDDTAKALRDIAGEEGASITEVVRRAVSVYKFFYEESHQAGKTIQLVDGHDKVTAIQMV